MSLPVLGALVVFGIGGVVLLVHLLGWSRAPRFADEAAARDALLEDYPHAGPGAGVLADDGLAAFFPCGARLGYAGRFGTGRLTRLLGPGEVRAVKERADELRLTLDDFTAPEIRFKLSDGAARAALKSKVEALL